MGDQLRSKSEEERAEEKKVHDKEPCGPKKGSDGGGRGEKSSK